MIEIKEIIAALVLYSTIITLILIGFGVVFYKTYKSINNELKAQKNKCNEVSEGLKNVAKTMNTNNNIVVKTYRDLVNKDRELDKADYILSEKIKNIQNAITTKDKKLEKENHNILEKLKNIQNFPKK
jgi:predicted PurR-regulated permease PerM